LRLLDPPDRDAAQRQADLINRQPGESTAFGRFLSAVSYRPFPFGRFLSAVSFRPFPFVGKENGYPCFLPTAASTNIPMRPPCQLCPQLYQWSVIYVAVSHSAI
jgi:hypothetical protein